MLKKYLTSIADIYNLKNEGVRDLFLKDTGLAKGGLKVAAWIGPIPANSKLTEFSETAPSLKAAREISGGF